MSGKLSGSSHGRFDLVPREDAGRVGFVRGHAAVQSRPQGVVQFDRGTPLDELVSRAEEEVELLIDGPPLNRLQSRRRAHGHLASD